MSNVENLIDQWSKSLSERLIEIRFIDIDDMKAAMKVHLKSAIFDCLKIQLPDTEQALIAAKNHYVTYGGGSNNHIQSNIITLKQKLKEENKLFAHLDRDNCAKEMALWMRKHHEQSLIEFYKYYDTVRGFEIKRP